MIFEYVFFHKEIKSTIVCVKLAILQISINLWNKYYAYTNDIHVIKLNYCHTTQIILVHSNHLKLKKKYRSGQKIIMVIEVN